MLFLTGIMNFRKEIILYAGPLPSAPAFTGELKSILSGGNTESICSNIFLIIRNLNYMKSYDHHQAEHTLSFFLSS